MPARASTGGSHRLKRGSTPPDGRQQGASHSRLHPAQQRPRAPQPKPGTVSFSRLSQVASGVRASGWRTFVFSREDQTPIAQAGHNPGPRRLPPPPPLRAAEQHSHVLAPSRFATHETSAPAAPARELVHGVLPPRPRGPTDSRPQRATTGTGHHLLLSIISSR